MSGSSLGGIIGGGIGLLFGAPQLGFFIGSTLGGIISPQKIYGPKLSDASRQTAMEGVPIPWGYGTYPVAGHLIACSEAIEHERKEGGKGGPQQVSYYYTRTYAIAFGEGEGTIVKIKRNGKLVYDITPTSTIRGKNAKFTRNHTLYSGTETQVNDPTLEAVFGADDTHPYRGMIYLVADDVECKNAAAVDTYEAVIQKCGAVTNLLDDRVAFVAAMEGNNSVETGTRAGVWTAHAAEIPGDVSLGRVDAQHNLCVAIDGNEDFWRSTDGGANWVAVTTPPPAANREWRDVAIGGGRVVVVGKSTVDATKSYVAISTDEGDNFTEAEMVGVEGAHRVIYGSSKFVCLCGSNGADVNGIWTSTTAAGGDWTQRSTVSGLADAAFNGTNWMAVGNNGVSYWATSAATTWTDGGSLPGGGSWSFNVVTGGPGFFVAGANGSNGIWRTTDLGANWTNVHALASDATGAAYGLGVAVMGDGSQSYLSDDAGATWTAHAYDSALHYANDIAFMGPNGDWHRVPDAEDLWADEDGVLIDEYADTEEASACTVTVGDIVADLCDRAGVDSSEYDTSDLTDTVKGYRCATESSAAGFIEPLAAAFFFDRGEWDKKLRFVPRGGSPVAALTMDDLVAQEGPAIEWEQVQETDLLRKVNILTLDPNAEYAPTKQTWERRSSTITARGEATVEMPIVTDGDTAAQIAEKRGKVAWDETDRAKFGLTMKWSKLTPTDIVTLTDRAAKVHRLRLQANHEESGVFTVEEAVKDRASTYTSTAVGATHEQVIPPTEGLVGPTLLALMNLAQLRNQDSTPGIYVGVCGILAGWPGAQLLMSVDGGVSYTAVLTVTVPTRMGYVTAATDSGDALLPVRVFGGSLESKTTAQVASGANHAAVIDASGVAEVLNYEDATATGTRTYDLEALVWELEGTVAGSYVDGDQFVDLTTAYFLPIPQDYAGDTLYFKAVGIGLSADDVDAVAFVYAGWEIVYDGGDA